MFLVKSKCFNPFRNEWNPTRSLSSYVERNRYFYYHREGRVLKHLKDHIKSFAIHKLCEGARADVVFNNGDKARSFPEQIKTRKSRKDGRFVFTELSKYHGTNMGLILVGWAENRPIHFWCLTTSELGDKKSISFTLGSQNDVRFRVEHHELDYYLRTLYYTYPHYHQVRFNKS